MRPATKTSKEQSEWLSALDVRTMFSVRKGKPLSHSTLFAWRKLKKIAFIRFGKRYRYPRRENEAILGIVRDAGGNITTHIKLTKEIKEAFAIGKSMDALKASGYLGKTVEIQRTERKIAAEQERLRKLKLENQP